MSLHHIKNWHSDKDDCARFPCQHGGTCTNDIGFYNCTCIPGWTGQDCHQGNIKENTFRNHSSPLRHSDSKNVILKEFKKKKPFNFVIRSLLWNDASIQIFKARFKISILTWSLKISYLIYLCSNNVNNRWGFYHNFFLYKLLV